MNSTAFFPTPADFALPFIVPAIIPLFMLLNCCASKKKKKRNDEISMKLKLATSGRKQAEDVYVSKTTNKVAGLGPDDPDLDSQRLKLIKAAIGSNQGEDQAQQAQSQANQMENGNAPVEENKHVPGPEDEPKTAEEGKKRPSTPRLPGKTSKTAKSARMSLVKLKEQRRQKTEPRHQQPAEMLRLKKDCLAAATLHLENQQSMPRLRPPIHHDSHRHNSGSQHNDSQSGRV